MIALKFVKHGIILTHNHPSGNLSPFKRDNGLVERMAKACKFLGITFVDDLIVTRKFYTSQTCEFLVSTAYLCGDMR